MGPKQIALYHRYCELRDRIDRNVAAGVLSSPDTIYGEFRDEDEEGKSKLKRVFSHRMDRNCFRSMTEDDMKACEQDLTALEDVFNQESFVSSL